jgi:hypothetical protein
MFSKQEVAKLAEGKNDEQLDALGRQYGFLQLACDWEGVDVKLGLKTSDFTRTNPFAHRAYRAGAIERVTAEALPTKPGDASVHPATGAFLPVTRVVFKGE